MTSWAPVKVRLLAGIERFVVEAERGGLNVYEDLGDLAVDDFHVTSEPCQSSENKPNSFTKPQCFSAYVYV